MSIKLSLLKADEELALGSSYFWDAPQLPKHIDYPFYFNEAGEEVPMTFVAQFNCKALSIYDKDGILPCNGMLYFFADVDYYLGYTDGCKNGIGMWKDGVKVIYTTSEGEALLRCNPFADSETITPYKIIYSEMNDDCDGHKLLGNPFDKDVVRNCFDEGWQLLFQLDSDEAPDYNIRFYDMGLLYWMIKNEDLKTSNFSEVQAMLTSY